MNEMQKERAKWAAIGAVVGIVIGLLAAGRYDLKPDKESGFAWRVDHWTGRAELLGPNGQPIMRQQQP
jgi:hypothetical protein